MASFIIEAVFPLPAPWPALPQSPSFIGRFDTSRPRRAVTKQEGESCKFPYCVEAAFIIKLLIYSTLFLKRKISSLRSGSMSLHDVLVSGLVGRDVNKSHNIHEEDDTNYIIESSNLWKKI